jgi:hypothetical protein
LDVEILSDTDVSPPADAGAGRLTCGDGKIDIFDVIGIAKAIISEDPEAFLIDRCTS